MKFFITGATGFIGGILARRLAAQGHEVIALARTPENASLPGIRLVKGDITDKASLREPMRGVDGVFHLAAWYRVGARERSVAEKMNVEGTRNVLETMADLGIPKGVYTSTAAIFSDTQGRLPDETYRFRGKYVNEYERTKALAHYEVALPMIAQGLPLVIVMPALVYGAGDQSGADNFLRWYLQGYLRMIPAGTAFSWGHVEDTVQGHLLAMDKGKPGESYLITGEYHTLQAALAMAGRITGINRPVYTFPAAPIRAFGHLMGLVEKVLPVPGVITAEALLTVAGTSYGGSSTKAERELGYQSRSLAQGLRETLPGILRELRMKNEETHDVNLID